MKPIKKSFVKLGNSIGIVVDKILLKESEIEPTDKVEITCGKNRITLKKVTNEKQ